MVNATARGRYFCRSRKVAALLGCRSRRLDSICRHLSYHQDCISCINYPSNKLSFIRQVLNKSRTHNSLGQRLVVVSSVFFLRFSLPFQVLYVRCVTFSLNML